MWSTKRFMRPLRFIRGYRKPVKESRSPWVIAMHKEATSANAWKQLKTKAAYYRGGTSRGIIVNKNDLPVDTSLWPSMFLRWMGSPDPYGRQLDGMGAGISSLSKICIVSPSEREDADVDYTFVGIGIEKDEVDMAGNCGNMAAAIGPYAYNSRLLKRFTHSLDEMKEAEVRIHNTNTGVIINSKFPVAFGEATTFGDFAIDGVNGTGARITLDFIRPGGSKTGKLLPTGNVVDTISGIEASCVDAANPCVFVRAEDIGVDGTILPNDFNRLPDKLRLLEAIRERGAELMGIRLGNGEIPRTIPKIAIVSPHSTHKLLSGESLEKTSVDFVVRFISDTQPHRAIPLTGALCTAAAAKISGSIVHQCLSRNPVDPEMITIGHSSGKIQVNATMDKKGEVESASVYRTARRIFEGKIF